MLNNNILRKIKVINKNIYVICIAAIIGAILGVYFPIKLINSNKIKSLYYGDYTVYSDKFNRKNFEIIESGMASNQVVSLIGNPISKSNNKEYSYWIYTRNSLDSKPYLLILIVFKDGKVNKKEEIFTISK